MRAYSASVRESTRGLLRYSSSAALIGIGAGTTVSCVRLIQSSYSVECSARTGLKDGEKRLKRLSSNEAALTALNEHVQPSNSRISALLRALRSLFRALYLSAVFTPLALTYHLSHWIGYTDAWWTWLIWRLESSGALLIKLAQWSSSRPDLFGEDVCRRLVHLQDAGSPHSWRHTVQALDDMFGRSNAVDGAAGDSALVASSWQDYLRLEATPIGSGCIAQVYRGELLDASTGSWEPVAVKVVHPHVGSQIAADMDLLRGVGWLLEQLPKLKWLNPGGMLVEFAGLLLMQLDLSVEADHLDTFNANFPRADYDGIVAFPTPRRPYVSRDVLVETFVEGEPFVVWAKTRNPTAEVRQRICNHGIDAVIKMIFVDNFVHGDLHPGNIFVNPTTGELAFLDAGICVRYTDAVHEHLIDVLSAFIRYDGYEGGRLMAARSEADAAEEGGTSPGVHDLHGFCVKIQKMVEMARDEPSFFDKLGECIGIICQAACDHRIRLQSGFISIALSVKVVEGALLQVDPLCVVAPRAKAVVVREQLRRRGLRRERASLEEELRREEAESRREQEARLKERAAAGGKADWSGRK